MYNFFVNENQKLNDKYVITGTDFNHIKNVLRMTVGDTFLVSENGVSNLCEIECFDNESVVAKIIEELTMFFFSLGADEIESKIKREDKMDIIWFRSNKSSTL